MKSKIIIIIFLFGFYHLNAQDSTKVFNNVDSTYKTLNLSELKLPDSIITKLQNGRLVGEVIVNFKGKSAPQIYDSIMLWVSYTFRNTKAVIQSTIKNRMVRISGISYFYTYKHYSFDLSYILQLDIKDEKMRFSAYDLKQISELSPSSVVDLNGLYKKNGKLRTFSAYRELKHKLDGTLTGLLYSLVSYIYEGNSNSNDNW